MKRVLGITSALLTLGFVLPAEAKSTTNLNENATVAANAAPQYQRYRQDRRWDRRNRRTVTRSRIVRVGRRVYRETYIVRYLPNGRVDTRVISRTRIS